MKLDIKNRILIVSLWGNYNYGNKLQSYALNRVLEKLGYSTVIAMHDIPKRSFKSKIKSLFIKGQMKEDIKSLNKDRENKFKEFSNNYIEECIEINNFNTQGIDPKKYLAAVVGSDQVWRNWYNTNSELSYYFLRFMPKNKRISYAASFGFGKIPLSKTLQYRIDIRGIKYCSCREESGAKLVSSITKKECPVVVDPTLCLNNKEWSSIERKPDYVKDEKYALLYFIAGLSYEYKEYIENYAKINNYKIINVYDEKNEYFGKTGPSEFIWLIHNAQAIFTDSFHSTVFSIIFKKQFLVFHRIDEVGEGSYDRIRTLLNMTKLNNCEYKKCEPFKICEQDLINANKHILEEANKSIEWLSNSLKDIKDE